MLYSEKGRKKVIKSKQEKKFQFLAHLVLIIVCLMTVIPFVIMISSSFSEEVEILAHGYSIFPKGFSLDAYSYIFQNAAVVFKAYGVTILVTAVGTFVSVVITNMFAYVLAQTNVPFVNIMMFLVVLSMLFNGGLVPTYYVYTQIFQIKDTILALIVPNLMMSAFNLILVRNYFRTSIPFALIESAKIDGCSKFKTYMKIVLPLSLPITATIGLLTGLLYWNDWQNSLYYMTGSAFQSLQQLLRLMVNNVQYIQQSGSYVESMEIPLTTVRMAIAVIAVIPVLIVYPFFQKYFVKGITIGAVKE